MQWGPMTISVLKTRKLKFKEVKSMVVQLAIIIIKNLTLVV